ncbi:uncharacterized protein yc1106_07760 [Curvularia clavata]|uniref:Rhodopsin domain-containing protein n=1 Tax=Curvularia clavata TaxID=95742 RepID=A0A9Q8ZC69_CURCL|nr:uncharacterized protein yc1106_07760 [Curvularia clavata]
MDNLTPEQLAVLAKEDQGPLTKSIVIAFTTLAVVAVVLRVFTRLRYVGVRLGWEDYTIIVSLMMTIVSAVFQILQANAGNGKHIMFVDVAQMKNILHYLFWSIVFYNISLTCTKMSILLQYRRIFNVQTMRIPLTWYAAASMNIFSDLLVAFLPVRVIWNLQIAKRPKIALIGIMTIGCAAAAYWSSIEMNLAIVCASLPALKPLVVKIIPGFSSRGGSDGYGLGTDGHTKVKITSHGVRSTARRADMDDIELGVSGSTVYPNKPSDDGVLSKNIYVSRQFSQHYDDNSRNSDSESQKDLVERY